MTLHDTISIGDDFPPVLMGVLNLSPESFYKGSVYSSNDRLKAVAEQMISNGARILDLGARSTAPWSKKISLDEEINRLIPALTLLCELIPKQVLISIDTQYKKVAKNAYQIASDYNKNIIINDVSCLRTDPEMTDFLAETGLPVILMATKNVPGDLLKMEDIINVFNETINQLRMKRYDTNKIILDPGIGRWIEEKTPEHDMKLISDLEKLRVLQKPILMALSRKSFIGSALKIEDPEKRYNGTLAATAISAFNGAHIIRSHDINQQIAEIVAMAKIMRENR